VTKDTLLLLTPKNARPERKIQASWLQKQYEPQTMYIFLMILMEKNVSWGIQMKAGCGIKEWGIRTLTT
jgi:hypothetical protein